MTVPMQPADILLACLQEAGDDISAGLEAAEYILSTDAQGHEHRGKGKGGGQFVSRSVVTESSHHNAAVIASQGIRSGMKPRLRDDVSEFAPGRGLDKDVTYVSHPSHNVGSFGDVRIHFNIPDEQLDLPTELRQLGWKKEHETSGLDKALTTEHGAVVTGDVPASNISRVEVYNRGSQSWESMSPQEYLKKHHSIDEDVPRLPNSTEYRDGLRKTSKIHGMNDDEIEDQVGAYLRSSLQDKMYLAEELRDMLSQVSLSIYLSFDIHNRRAQGILNRTIQATKKLTTAARKDLTAALKRANTGEAIVNFIDKYRLQLARILTQTQLASLLEGAVDVAKKIPTLATFPGAVPPPPTLEPEQAIALVDRLEKLEGDARAKAIYGLPTDQQQYVQQALAAKELTTAPPIKPPPPIIRTPPLPGSPEEIHFPVIEEAIQQLGEKNVMTRPEFDALDAQARAKAFTVANVQAEETLTKIRDSLAENIKEGVDFETWRNKVLEDVDEGTFLSEGHMETVFRTNIQSQFSDGQETVLQHPLVRSGFPYRARDAIHDSRVREEHLALERYGIQGTNIYRADDPVWQLFRVPWGYNDRCSDTPLTVRQASEAGIKEAQQWLETGVGPTEKAFVEMPPFQPPPGFQRAIITAPLSIRLSMQSMAMFAHDVSGERRDEGGKWTAGKSGSTDEPSEYQGRDSLSVSWHGEGKAFSPDVTARSLNDAGLPSKAESAGATVGIGQAKVVATLKKLGWEHVTFQYRDGRRIDALSKGPHRATVEEDGPRTTGVFITTGHQQQTTLSLGENYAEKLEASYWNTEQFIRLSAEPTKKPEEETDESLLYGAPEVGGIGSSTLDTAKVPKTTRVGRGTKRPRHKHRHVNIFKRVRRKRRWKNSSSVALATDYNGRGTWITIGGKPGKDKEGNPTKHSGGFRIKVSDDGRILTGRLRGEKLGNIKGIRKKFAKLKGKEQTLGRKRQRERKQQQRTDPRSTGGPAPQRSTKSSQQVEAKASRPRNAEASGGRVNRGKSTSPNAPRRIPPRIEAVNRKLDRFAEHFRQKGQHEVANWMGMLRSHINDVGVESALESLGTEVAGPEYKIQYGGAMDISDFAESYLDRVGISLVPTGERPKSKGGRVVSSLPPSKEGFVPRKGSKSGKGQEDVAPVLQTLKDKLDETQRLPGLESSKDLGDLMGIGFGSKVSHFTTEVTKKLDDTYGEGKWIVRPYTDEAYGGYGIFFPDRVKQIQRDAQNTIWSAGEHLARYGFQLERDPDTKKVIGLQHSSGDTYQFGTKEYNDTIQGDARYWADKAAHMASSEHGADIDQWSPKAEEGKAGGGTGENFPTARFMVSPVFQVVGITNEERAQGITFKKGQEGRVHIHTRNGKAEIIPHSTWLKKESMPVVFENDDTRAMAQAAVDAINALPESERKGQLYAPDIIKTTEGYKVVEANPANEAGASGYLADNPFIIDSYVSHVVGREPEHVRFIRKLLSGRTKSLAMAIAVEQG